MAAVTIHIALPEDLHTRVKMKAAAQRLTLKAYVMKTLAQSVEEQTGGKRKE